jgi:hypothetical protein
MTMWRMLIACRIPKATQTFGIHNTNCFSAPTSVGRTRRVTLYATSLSRDDNELGLLPLLLGIHTTEME